MSAVAKSGEDVGYFVEQHRLLGQQHPIAADYGALADQMLIAGRQLCLKFEISSSHMKVQIPP
jgi:hypothetical protein